jgi:hypothetical protein
MLVGGLQQGWKISKILEACRNVLGSDLCTSQQNRQMQNFVADTHLPITLLLWYIHDKVYFGQKLNIKFLCVLFT